MPRYRVAVDTGGTFSDFVYLNEATGAVSITKVPSTPDDPSRAILAGHRGADRAARRCAAAGLVGFFCHGTTVGTNALLEGKGVRTGAAGDRRISRHLRSRRAGAALRHRDLRRDVRQAGPRWCRRAAPARCASGSISAARCCVPLDETALRDTLRGLKAKQIEALAVCLLFSFLHPAARSARARDRAEELPGCNVSLSSEILPQIREYYRLSTTVINAYLQPILARYIANLDRRLTGCRRRDAAEIHHAVERRHVDLRRGGAHRRDHGAVRAGRRRHRRRLCRRDDRHRQHHHLRHGRHLLRRGADQGRRADLHQPRQDRRPRHRRADDGHQHGERRRRHHRQGRPLRRARSRPAKRRRGAGPGLLRPRRRSADHHRLQSRARLSQRR